MSNTNIVVTLEDVNSASAIVKSETYLIENEFESILSDSSSILYDNTDYNFDLIKDLVSSEQALKLASEWGIAYEIDANPSDPGVSTFAIGGPSTGSGGLGGNPPRRDPVDDIENDE